MSEDKWPSTVFASVLLVVIAAIAIVAMLQYEEVDDALKIWTALAALVGVVTGSAATYFFTRDNARKAEALPAVAAALEPARVEELKRNNAAVRAVL